MKFGYVPSFSHEQFTLFEKPIAAKGGLLLLPRLFF